MSSLQISESILASASECIDSVLGLYFTKEKWSDLERAFASVYRDLGYSDIESLALRIAERKITGRELEILASALTIGETYFFRERNSLNVFEYSILPALIKERKSAERRIRIWSAGCASGEEPYTIAMILKRYIPDNEKWDITLTATDINTAFISRAAAGVYTAWSFRDLPQWIIDKYFVKKSGNSFELKSEIRSMVSFAYLNLIDDKYPSILNNTNSMDVIFCRNVLMYFSPEKISRVAGKLYNSLNNGGYLITGQAELSDIYFSSFDRVTESGAVVYRKDEKLHGAVHGGKSHASKSHDKKAATHLLKIDNNTAVSKIGAVTGNNSPDSMEKAKENRTTSMDEIRRLYESGDYDKAREQLTSLLKTSGRSAEALALLARIYANMGMLAEAEEYCSEAAAAESFNPHYQYLLAVIHREAGRIDESISALRRAIYIDTEFVAAYYMLGVIYLSQNNSREADKNFRAALDLLRSYRPDEPVPESEGVPAAKLAEIISSLKPGMLNA